MKLILIVIAITTILCTQTEIFLNEKDLFNLAKLSNRFKERKSHKNAPIQNQTNTIPNAQQVTKPTSPVLPKNQNLTTPNSPQKNKLPPGAFPLENEVEEKRNIEFKGDVKYFKFLVGDKKSGNKFFVNEELMKRSQTDSNSQTTKENDKGSIDEVEKQKQIDEIRKQGDKAVTFNLRLTNQNVLIYPTDDKKETSVDTLIIDHILPINSDEADKIGGIKDEGSYKEGSCLEIFEDLVAHKAPVTPSAGMTAWVFCFKDDAMKNRFFRLLREAKLELQSQKGIFVMKQGDDYIGDNIQKITSVDTLFNQSDKPELVLNAEGKVGVKNKLPGVNNDRDGFWTIVSDWSVCSKVCGGGRSKKERKCSPPVGKGKPCQGPNIIFKACNTHVCPPGSQGMNDEEKATLKSNVVVSIDEPDYEEVQLSQDPQNFIMCKVFAQDVKVIAPDQDPTSKNPTFLLVRITMTPDTIELKNLIDPKNPLPAFSVTQTKISTVNLYSKCFMLVQGEQKVVVCPFNYSDPPSRKSVKKFEGEFANKWFYNFGLFKNQCKKSKQVIDLSESEKEELQGEFEEKMMKAKLEAERKIADEQASQLIERSNNDFQEQFGEEARKAAIELSKLKKKKELEMEEELMALEEEKKQLLRKKKEKALLLEMFETQKHEKERENQLHENEVQKNKIITELKERTQKESENLSKLMEENKNRLKLKTFRQMERIKREVQGETERIIQVYSSQSSDDICQKALRSENEAVAYCAHNAGNRVNECLAITKDPKKFCHFCMERVGNSAEKNCPDLVEKSGIVGGITSVVIGEKQNDIGLASFLKK